MSTATPSRLAGLDGLRAVAVLLVMALHLFPAGPMRGGYVGVDVFFVISGFLITSLLLRERAATGRIALRRFWTRRARRLLPALALVVTVTGTAAWTTGGDVLVGLGRQIAGAAAFAYNWVAIAAGTSYFSAGEPEVLRNLWSLAVEEQFYLLWPVLLPLFLLLPARWMRIALSLGLAGASAGWAFALIAGADPTRAYYGTDSHAFGLLLGVGLAFALHGRPAPRPSVAGVGPAWGAVIGACAVLGLVAAASGDLAFPTSSIAASALTAAIIVVATRPGSWFGRALDVAPMRWIGERSYGIYLWHWPLVVLLTAATTRTSADAAVPGPVGILTFALTIAIAAASYRWIEQPVRRLGFGGTARALAARLTSTPARRSSAIATLAAAALVLGGTTAAVAAAPPVSSSQSAIEAGQAALDSADAGRAAPSSTPDVAADAGAGNEAPEAGDAPPAGSAGAGAATGAGSAPPADARVSPVAAATAPLECASPGAAAGCPPGDSSSHPAPAPVDGSRISAIGDSVMLASAPGLLERFPGIQVDAAVSRSMWAGPGIVRALADSGQLRDFVVVALGTNGPVDQDSLQELYDAVGPRRHLVLVNAFAPRDWIPGVNDTLAAFARTHSGVAVADWSGVIAGQTDLLAGDQIHPGAGGANVFADAVGVALDGMENRAAQARERIERLTASAAPAAR